MRGEVDALRAQQAEDERRANSPEAYLKAASNFYLSCRDGLGSVAEKGLGSLGWGPLSDGFWRLERNLHGFSDAAEKAMARAGAAPPRWGKADEAEPSEAVPLTQAAEGRAGAGAAGGASQSGASSIAAAIAAGAPMVLIRRCMKASGSASAA